MKAGFVEPVLDSTRRAFDAMLGLEPWFSPAAHDDGSSADELVTCAVPLRGRLEGVVRLGVPPDVARRMAGLLSASDDPVADEDLGDVVKELAEAIAGGSASAASHSPGLASLDDAARRDPASDSAGTITIMGECECGEFVLLLDVQGSSTIGGSHACPAG